MAVGKPLVLPAAILLASASGALAQTGASPPAATGTPSTTPQGMPMSGMAMGSTPGVSGCMPMMGMMQMMMGQNAMAGHIEGRIAFLKTELKITDEQQPLWNAVADAMRREGHAEHAELHVDDAVSDADIRHGTRRARRPREGRDGAPGGPS